jgi:hypothetical protein
MRAQPRPIFQTSPLLATSETQCASSLVSVPDFSRNNLHKTVVARQLAAIQLSLRLGPAWQCSHIQSNSFLRNFRTWQRNKQGRHSRKDHINRQGISPSLFVSLQFLILRHTVGLLGRVISPSQGRYLTQTQNKHKQTSVP